MKIMPNDFKLIGSRNDFVRDVDVQRPGRSKVRPRHYNKGQSSRVVKQDDDHLARSSGVNWYSLPEVR